MAKTIELLLTESVDNLGIVGDVVKVRTGYARNFLLPRSMATEPSEEMIKSLAVKRADAEKEIAQIRKARESTVSKLSGIEIQLTRACNDMGILYGAVTQQEISKALQTKGYDVRPRDVRIPHAIKRVDTYEIHIKFEADLEAVIKLWVMPDRKLDEDKKSDMDFDREGNLIEARPGRDRDRGHREDREEKAAGPAAPAEKPAKADKAEKSDKTEKPAKAEKAEKADKADKPAKEKAPKAPKAPKAEKGDKAIEKSTKGSWSKPIEKAPDFMQERKPRRSKD